jgi:hypothetical protein
MTTADILWLNIPLAVLFIALWVGIPLWMIHRHPDRHPRETRTVPAYLRQRTSAWDRAERHELVGAGRSR